MLLYRTYCHVSLVAFSGGKCRACFALPEVPASDLPVLIHSRWFLPDPLRHPSLPGVSLFRGNRCYLDCRPASQPRLRHQPLPGVSRFRRIGSHLRRVTQASGPALWQRPGTGCLLRCFCVEQEAARSRGAAQQDIPACLVAKPAPEPRPGLWMSRDCRRGTPTGAWNNAVRTRGVSTHRDDFQKPACAERGLVRTGTAPIISESAVAWTFLVITSATVGREESLS